ncbi:hypothetical protein MOQ72_27260 [Saccharopolyspora sp. K220]|uniref:hypothetical protein n=1 Tax=Saccharopolyspora soli TaxID=2926618 RepID=UPI001F5A0949|nr:hypothetical protein [Saccharopolyspora soli]MCI2421148.1 hypothetical protein [Saccharopolyspora soli]
MTLDLADAAELAELLQFLRDWFTSGHDDLNASLTEFVGDTGYDLRELRGDLDRFAFLLGGNDGESLFQLDPS